MKWTIFHDGTNRCGFGASANVFEYHSYTGSSHNFILIVQKFLAHHLQDS